MGKDIRNMSAIFDDVNMSAIFDDVNTCLSLRYKWKKLILYYYDFLKTQKLISM